jgi:hypothetical protein
MTWTYAAGTTTPTLAGLIEFNGARINDGSLRAGYFAGLLDAPPVRDSSVALPSDHGASPGQPFYGARNMQIQGWVETTVADDLPLAMDYLRNAFNLYAGLQELVVNCRGFTARRQTLARVVDAITFNDPGLGFRRVPRRDFIIPMIAPDPLLYNADTLHSLTVTSTSLTNSGSMPTPFVVRFNGPLTNPALNGPGVGNIVKYTGVIASGHWVEVGTNPASVTGVYAVDDNGADVYGGTASTGISNFTARVIAPGSGTWVATADAGSGTTVVSFRDAWA